MTDGNVVLAVLAEEAGAQGILRHAAHAAGGLPAATLTALHVRVEPYSTIMPTEEMLSKAQVRAIEVEGEREGAALLGVFEAWRSTAGIMTDWKDVVGTLPEQVHLHAENAALVVTGIPGPKARGYALTALHAALFETDRPVLAVPQVHVAGPVSRIMIGWKSSDVSSRAVRAALPWLRRADEVHVIHVGDGAGELAAARQILAELGIRATASAVPEDGLTDGDRLLAEVEAFGADWLVMGAYRHARVTEWLFGGVTRTVLHDSHVPLFLVH